MRHNKSLTLLKLDDINNIGSMKLRVRSMIESLKLANADGTEGDVKDFTTVPVYDKSYRDRKILVPYFTPFISPLIPAIMKVAGYDAENLPLSDNDSSEWGLKYANNEVCYPATLIVGDIIKALKSRSHHPNGRTMPCQQLYFLDKKGVGGCRIYGYSGNLYLCGQ